MTLLRAIKYVIVNSTVAGSAELRQAGPTFNANFEKWRGREGRESSIVSNCVLEEFILEFTITTLLR